ncbi:MAG: transaldolase family protein [Myxococcales bacterium]
MVDMKAIRASHDLGQSLWLDNITRDLLSLGKLKRHRRTLGDRLTSNPTIFDHALGEGASYDAAILEGVKTVCTGELLFFDLAIDDLRRAADLFRPSTSGPTASTAGSPSRSPRCSRPTPRRV